jgi:hypothetical protein
MVLVPMARKKKKDATLPGGTHLPGHPSIPMNESGAQVCQTVVSNNAGELVTWGHSYVTPDKKKTFCLYDAPSPEAIRHVARKNHLPVDKITEVSVLDPYFYSFRCGSRASAAEARPREPGSAVPRPGVRVAFQCQRLPYLRRQAYTGTASRSRGPRSYVTSDLVKKVGDEDKKVGLTAINMRFWRRSLKGRIAASCLAASTAALVLVVGTLTTSLLFSLPAAASKQQYATVSPNIGRRRAQDRERSRCAPSQPQVCCGDRDKDRPCPCP